MLMKCSKCGYENQLNAIFCRGCGEKLNPAEVSPEALAQEAEKKKKASRKINWKPILGLVLLT
ncbi:MAG: zinc ribbon domain-containing protein, partial [Lentisphaeria bacterium]|nr:zinc ribbon domain-containing protein [Lentisphaeria bacterium]